MVAAICLSSVGGLSIAMVIPGNEINLSAGVMQTFYRSDVPCGTGN
ncbi:glutamate/gamma-aminobutyrate antiporter (extreme acid sensitivity protein) [Escherichia coli]|uniref:Glutamate/gamma-aminobutyrate antiporter (Extreme acid sensitivity protein) n=1 Tax=Escherichia coli TaxID=562 RepID=A0A376KW03_ECOLX|nr:glutamate/gamma-aminobutyrate antiporter (extreme acid sensitivity protein) [Escherichia coli]